MDALHAFSTSIGVIGLILLIVLLVLHFFGPQTAAWIHSNREEKIGFSKNKIYHANGFLIQSGSELLLTSNGSFKRFESIDRDYKPVDQTSVQSPSWNITIPEVPPQPLRPAPNSPTHIETSQKSVDNSTQKYAEIHSCQSEVNDKTTVIPRPTTKRQFSSPANCGVAHINLSDVVAKINNGPKSCTNPFLNGSLSVSEDDNSNSIPSHETANNRYNNLNTYVVDAKLPKKNPFSNRQRHGDTPFFSFPSNGNINDNQATNNYSEHTESSNILIELNEETIGSDNDDVDVAGLSFPYHINKNTSSNCHVIHNRSHSDNGTTLLNTDIDEQSTTNPFNASNLHKTLSDTHLEQHSTQKKPHSYSLDHRTLSRQSIASACREQQQQSLNNHSPPTPNNLNEAEMKRAMSCESVNSESSVLLADLEQQQMPTVTGQLCVGLQYDKNTLTDEGIELVLTVMEAKDLIGPSDAEQFDTFVRIYMIPDETVAQQTKVFRNSKCPSYNETISFWLSNKGPKRRSLMFHVYHSGSIHTLIGETEFQIGDVRRPITTWLTLSDSKHNISPYGELMFSLSYLPTAERLTVVVVKARNLKINEDDPNISQQNVFVKVYLQKDARKVSKKRTSVKRADSCPIFNEAMIFSVPPYMLSAIQIRLTVVSLSDSTALIENSNTVGSAKPFGHVIVGCSTPDKGLKHWTQMMTSLRKPVCMWHAIRRTSHPTVKTE